MHQTPAAPSARPTSGLTARDRRLVRTMRVAGRLHRNALRMSGGRIGARWFGGCDIVQLSVRGRVTGRRFTVPLMSLPDGADLLVVASQGGVDREPQWWRNLLADPRGEVALRGERFPVVAQQVADAERPALWSRFVAAYAGFERYQAGVSRQIAIVRLRRDV